MSDDMSKDKLSDFLSVSPDVFWETDTSGTLTYISMQITGLVDKPPEKLLGKSLTDIFSGMSCHGDWVTWVQACMKGKLAPLNTLKVPTEDKRTVYISAYAQRFARGLRGYLRDVSEAVESTLNAGEVEKQLADTIGSIPYGVALFDKDDKLVFINNKNRDVFPGLQDLMVPGTPFVEFVRRTFTDGVQVVPKELQDKYFNKRMRLHRNGYGVRNVKLNDDRWVEISELITPEGNVVVSWADLTTQKRREQALASLLDDPSKTLSVPERAAKAISLALGCRFGGVVRLAAEGKKNAEVVALWDTDNFVSTFGYDYTASPCQKVYQSGSYVSMTEEIDYQFLPGHFETNKKITTYHGLPLRDQNGELIGHIFAMNDATEHDLYRQGREVFHLIGHWVEMEFRRQELHNAIIDSQKRFRDFAEVASDWFWEMGADLSFSFISEHAPESAQRKLTELIKAAHDQSETDWSQMALAQASSKIIAKRAFRDVQVSVVDSATQEELVFLVSARPVFDEAGEFAGYRGTGADMTDVMVAPMSWSPTSVLRARNRGCGKPLNHRPKPLRCTTKTIVCWSATRSSKISFSPKFLTRSNQASCSKMS
jgi:PAS domain-containing protein